ncbi:MgtC/SapB family protein [Streptacidiphilus sp. EB103A]|uniref:MgtC/SapB family protein n=1 Tax=Streptacidiphilus sp. EB103A TaxID=3156275 RepID=UPI0035113BE9
MIRRDGAGARGLNTAATLWCSAALGLLAAADGLLVALLGTLPVLTVHLALHPVARLLNHAPAAGTDPDAVRAAVILKNEHRAETHMRTLLLHSPWPPTG